MKGAPAAPRRKENSGCNAHVANGPELPQRPLPLLEKKRSHRLAANTSAPNLSSMSAFSALPRDGIAARSQEQTSRYKNLVLRFRLADVRFRVQNSRCRWTGQPAAINCRAISLCLRPRQKCATFQTVTPLYRSFKLMPLRRSREPLIVEAVQSFPRGGTCRAFSALAMSRGVLPETY